MRDNARVFKALGDPTRLAIFELVRRHGSRARSADDLSASVSRIAERFDLSLSTVSHHLKELRNAGLIQCEKRGQTVYCSVDTDALKDVQRFLAGGKP